MGGVLPLNNLKFKVSEMSLHFPAKFLYKFDG